MQSISKYYPVSIFLALFLAYPGAFPIWARDESESAEEIFEVEEELKTEEWEKQVEKKILEAPLKPEEFVVSGSKYAQSLKEAPATMTVLDEEHIRAYGISNLEELLRIVPGVNVVDINPVSRLFGIRGLFFLTSNTILVLVDGREVNCNFFGGVLWTLFPVTLEDIQRIEVIRGPGSVLFGANAYSGVINIITKHPREADRAFLSTHAGFYQSSFGGASLKASASHSIGKFGFRGAADYTEARGWFHPEDNRFPTYRGYFRTSYELSGRSALDIDGGYIYGDSYTYSWIGKLSLPESEVLYLNARYSHDPFRIQGYLRRMNVGFVMETPIIESSLLETFFPEMRGGLYNGEIRAEFTRFIGPKNRLTAGAAYLNNFIYSDSFVNSPQVEHRVGLFFQDEYHPLNNLIIYFGARYDWNSAVGEQKMFGSSIDGDLSPRASVVYLPDPRHSFRFSAGRAFRKPNFFESGFLLKSLEGTLLEDFLANPDAKNEHIDALELSHTGHLSRRIDLSTAIFYSQYRDTVIFQAQYMKDIDLGEENFGFTNQDGLFAHGYGGEMHLEVILPENVRGFANFSLLKVAVEDERAREIEELYPHYLINAGLRWRPQSGPSLSLLFHWVGPYTDEILNPQGSIVTVAIDPDEISQDVGNYLLVNLRASYRFRQGDVEAGVKIFNLLNNSTRQYPGVAYSVSGEEEAIYAGEEPGLAATVFIQASF